MTTQMRLVEAAGHLLDVQGESAVTLRAVGHAVGLSHNAPYKHFKNRDALLAAVATADFAALTTALRKVRNGSKTPRKKLSGALAVLVDYCQARPARYRLIFMHPELVESDAEFARISSETFAEFLSIVEECQTVGDLPDLPSLKLVGLILATLHGLLALDSTGQLRPQKGLEDVKTSLDFLLKVLAPTR